jgi:hypothetical protein
VQWNLCGAFGGYRHCTTALVKLVLFTLRKSHRLYERVIRGCIVVSEREQLAANRCHLRSGALL